jgi:hypothetical protein
MADILQQLKALKALVALANFNVFGGLLRRIKGRRKMVDE